MCLWTSQGNALLGSHFVLALVLRSSNFGPSADRLILWPPKLTFDDAMWKQADTDEKITECESDQSKVDGLLWPFTCGA